MTKTKTITIHPLRFARAPVSEGQLAGAVFSVVTDSPSETGGVPRRGEGVEKSPLAQNTTSADTCHHWGACGLCFYLNYLTVQRQVFIT